MGRLTTDLNISKATAKNWQRLKTDKENKLTQRANKTCSERHIVALGYLNCEKALPLLNQIANMSCRIEDAIFTVCTAKLKAKNIWQKAHVQQALAVFKQEFREQKLNVPPELLQSDDDVLGFLYQSLITEGERNRTGQYYTPQKILSSMLGRLTLRDGERLLDPCCGSGAFLMGVKTTRPEQLVGYDINPVAVMMARTNLLAKYADTVFDPQVFCKDFLADNDAKTMFDHIYTNPPWGADKQRQYKISSISSREKASMVVAKALSRLKPNGKLGCLLPTSILKIHLHQDIRSIILGRTTIEHIHLYSKRFDGVFTDFFSMLLTPRQCERQSYTVSDEMGTFNVVLTSSQQLQGQIVVRRQSSIDRTIIEKMESKRHDDLSHSLWALGIITGNNKEKLRPAPAIIDDEPIYTGKEVLPFRLDNATTFTRFTPKEFQQCANEELYRAPEKLIYKFIADRPVAAYDCQQRLCLNSANALIPQVDSLSVKSVCALLNSSLYHYYYKQRFTDIKILKGNLQQLPFPLLTAEQDAKLCALVDKAPASQSAINDIVFCLFGITPEEQTYIKKSL